MTHKRSYLIFFILLSSFALSAQTPKDSAWTKEGKVGLKLSQASFSNWATGGDNAIAFDLQGMYRADYKHNKHLWMNRAELAFGMANTKSIGARKTSDKIFANSTYGYQVAKSLYISGFLNYLSQFANGYDYTTNPKTFVSQFMAPGYLSTGAGITWTPNKYFTAVFSPATWRGTFVINNTLSQDGAFGVKRGENLLSEFGGNLTLEGRYDILKNMNIYSRLNLFSNYLRKPQNIAVSWDVQLNMTINKWFSASLATNLVYDDNIFILESNGLNKSRRVQFKELLGVGLQYNF